MQVKINERVKITNNHTYARCFINKTGIVVKLTGEGYNVYVPGINGGGSYFDQIFWFPAYCVEPIGKNEDSTIF